MRACLRAQALHSHGPGGGEAANRGWGWAQTKLAHIRGGNRCDLNVSTSCPSGIRRARLRPTSDQVSSTSAKTGPFRAQLDRVGPESNLNRPKFGGMSVQFVQSRPKSATLVALTCTELTAFGPNFGRIWPRPGHMSASSKDFGDSGTEATRIPRVVLLCSETSHDRCGMARRRRDAGCGKATRCRPEQTPRAETDRHARALHLAPAFASGPGITGAIPSES